MKTIIEIAVLIIAALMLWCFAAIVMESVMEIWMIEEGEEDEEWDLDLL